jgi:hypothetical protein
VFFPQKNKRLRRFFFLYPSFSPPFFFVPAPSPRHKGYANVKNFIYLRFLNRIFFRRFLPKHGFFVQNRVFKGRKLKVERGGFSHRTGCTHKPSPAGTVARKLKHTVNKVPSLRDLGSCDRFNRRLKSPVNKVPSLRDAGIRNKGKRGKG